MKEITEQLWFVPKFRNLVGSGKAQKLLHSKSMFNLINFLQGWNAHILKMIFIRMPGTEMHATSGTCRRSQLWLCIQCTKLAWSVAMSNCKMPAQCMVMFKDNIAMRTFKLLQKGWYLRLVLEAVQSVMNFPQNLGKRRKLWHGCGMKNIIWIDLGRAQVKPVGRLPANVMQPQKRIL